MLPRLQPLSVIICSDEKFVVDGIVEKIGGREFKDIFYGSFPFDLGFLVGAKPVFPTEDEIFYFRSVGINPKSTDYRVYVGTDIKEVTERWGVLKFLHLYLIIQKGSRKNSFTE